MDILIKNAVIKSDNCVFFYYKNEGAYMLDGLTVAMYVIDRCTRMGKPISNLQLQKILYYIQLNFYHHFNMQLIREEFEAWDYGPVIPAVYLYFRSYGATRICNLYESERGIFFENQRQEQLINRVIEVCTSVTAGKLVSISHSSNSPWAKVYERKHKNRIPNNLIREYANGWQNDRR